MIGPARPGRDAQSVEVADILRDHAQRFARSADQDRAWRAITACRTARLGGHLETCDDCGFSRPAYNSCRNRHCPKCQVLKQELWAEAQEARLLGVPYFHVVFTIPAHLHPLFRCAPKVALGCLFEAVSETLFQVAYRKLGARIGFTALLHTWTQKLLYHPHLHCIVPGGGLSDDGSAWIPSGERFFLHVRPLRTVFRGKLLSKLEHALDTGAIPFDAGSGKLLLRKAAGVGWVVYAKAPLAGPEQVVRYVSRYTHRIAISNSRIVDYDGENVSFRWRDRASGNRIRVLRLAAEDFTRRFLQHVLPRGFVRIRHFGLLSNRGRRDLERCRHALETPAPTPAIPPPPSQPAPEEDWVAAFTRIFGTDPLRCPHCGRGRMVIGVALPPRLEGPLAPAPARAPP